MSWIFFSLFAQALYATSNLFDKFLIEKRIRDYLTLTMFGGIVAFIFGLVILVVRHFPVYEPTQMILIILAGIFMELALLPYYKAVSLEDISRVAPTFQLIPVFVLIMSYFFLGERLTGAQLFGFFLILVGAYILSAKNFNKRIFGLRKSVGWILLASILWAIPSVIFKFVTIRLIFWDALGYEFMGAAVSIFILFLIPNIRRRFFDKARQVKNSVLGLVIPNESIYLIGRISGFYAIVLAPAVSLVVVFGGFTPVFVLIYGTILSVWFPHIIKEDIQKSTIMLKLCAIILIFGGAWLISR